jgi:hypothetical protein
MKKIMQRDAVMITAPNERNPGARKSFLNSAMVDTDCSSGPFNWDGQIS